MADQLFLSYVLRGYTGPNMLRHWEKVLRPFPFSRLAKSASVLRVQAIDFSEPAIFEQPFENPLNLEDILAAAREFQAADTAVQLETWWDLWQFGTDWSL